mmetsp:Transcript_56569/g.143123  ORF Transcript_56569/g.143123 Transcript_56569/m.143123 type:complete len:127 (+) Transcript_56569:83-463(+)
MTFAAFARWAMPRNVHLSAFNRNLAVQMRLHRGLAASPVLRLAAEPRPLSGFVEQSSGGVALVAMGSGSEDVSAVSTAASDTIASILNGIAELDASTSMLITEMLELSTLRTFNGSCYGLISDKRT